MPTHIPPNFVKQLLLEWKKRERYSFLPESVLFVAGLERLVSRQKERTVRFVFWREAPLPFRSEPLPLLGVTNEGHQSLVRFHS